MKELKVLAVHNDIYYGDNYEELEGYGALRYIERLTNEKIFETLETLNKERDEEPVDFEELYANYVKENDKALYVEYLEEIKAEETFEDFETWLIYCGNAYSRDILNVLDKFTDYVGGTVGYSQWSYYIAHESIEREFINDLYHGDGFYHVVVLDKNNDVDFGFSLYLKNRVVSEIITELKDHLDIDNYTVKYVLDSDVYLENDTEYEEATKETAVTWK